MVRHPVFHQIIPVNGLLPLILLLQCSAELNEASMLLPSGLAFLPLIPPPQTFFCPGYQSSAGATPHQGAERAVTVLPEAFRESQAPLSAQVQLTDCLEPRLPP